MYRLCLLYLIYFLSCCDVQGQYFQFSQYDFTPQRINPALVASSDFASLDLLYRKQEAAELLSINSTSMSMSYPLIRKNGGHRWSGVGISFLDDRSGEAGIFRINEVGISYGVNAFLTRNQTFSLGFKTLYQTRSLAIDALYTGSQYIVDRGFDISKGSGESLDELNRNLLTFSAGINWQMVNRRGEKIAYAGLSFFDFNKSEESFFGNDSQLPVSFVMNGGFLAYEQEEFTVFPEALITRTAATTTYNIGAVSSYALRNPVSEAKINFITKYVIAKYAIAGIQFEKEHFKVGFSYDIPLSQQVGNTGAFEFGLAVKRLVKSKTKYKSTKGRKKVKANKNRRYENNRQTKKITPKKKEEVIKRVESEQQVLPDTAMAALEEVSEHPLDSLSTTTRAGEMKSTPLYLEKTKLYFHFNFESSEIDEASRLYLAELSQILKQDPLLVVNIKGHTDARGSDEYNMELSRRRVKVIRDVLIGEGISPKRITTTPMGESQPIDSNATEAGRAKNRRVEFVISY